MQLALYVERNQLNFTELRQVSQLISLTINLIIYIPIVLFPILYIFFFNWKKIDLEKIQVDDDAGIVIPRIICPLERKRALALERLVRQMDISWKNSIKCYLKIRDYVLSYQ
jgi:hypothetical protein